MAINRDDVIKHYTESFKFEKWWSDQLNKSIERCKDFPDLIPEYEAMIIDSRNRVVYERRRLAKFIQGAL